MLGLLALGFTTFMIFTLVKNALLGRQLSSEDTFNGTIELIIPINARSEFYLEAWQKTFEDFHFVTGQLKVHVLIDGHHPSLPIWNVIKEKLPYLELHSFPLRPVEREPIPWMLEQIAPEIQGQVVILGDAELVPNQHAFLSLGKLVTEKQKSYFVLPQTAKLNLLGEAVASLNPTLALASFFGFRKWRLNLSHPLMGISQGWMAMTLATFKELDFKSTRFSSWKDITIRQWEAHKRSYNLAFGEKHLKRHYPQEIRIQFNQMKNYWQWLWDRPQKAGFGLFLLALFLWSFPVLFMTSHPFWSLASILLLVAYRFFSKIVFQESWASIMFHPVACLIWIVSLFSWIGSGLKQKLIQARS
jgi:hypothetical protein